MSLSKVLILVLVDVGLGRYASMLTSTISNGLNPCFSGCWSRTGVILPVIGSILMVLILVLVDVGLGRRMPQ